MINLLPYEDRKKIRQESLRRFLVIAIFETSLVLFAGILLIFPVSFSFKSQKDGLEREESVSRQGAPLDQLKEVEKEIKKLNSELTLLEAASKSGEVSDIFIKIMDSKPAGISIDEFLYSRQSKKILLAGNAAVRDDLVKFQEVLGSLEFSEKLESPLSNILKRENVDFSINLYIK